MLWDAAQYAAQARVSLRTAQYTLRAWHAAGARAPVRVYAQRQGSRTRYLLDAASWQRMAA